jgi:hypothetical protein
MMEEQNSHHHTTKRVPKWPATIQPSGERHSKLLQLLRAYITVLAAELLRVVAEATELLCVCTKDELRAAFAGGADTSAATAARLDVVRGYVLVMDNFCVE